MTNGLDPRYGNLIFDNIPCGIFTVDESGIITAFNLAAEEMTGWRRLEVIGRPCSQVFQNARCHESCFLQHSIERAETHTDEEVTIQRRDGRQLLVAISTAALKDEDGRIIGGVEMFKDLSVVEERKVSQSVALTNLILRRQLKASWTLADIVTKSESMQGVRELLPLVAKSFSTVLVEGEPGTGKELIARTIHNLGPRAAKPFVAVNCGALPDGLVESELFGYKKGAFTDAIQDKPGRFALAEGGSLFLDEVGELSPAMQVKLLRVLQDREFVPLGGVRASKADVRILAAPVAA